MDTGLNGRTVLITGAGRNIGREMALAFAREGANLALCTRRNLEGLEQTAAAARERGARTLTGACDVTDPAAVRRFVAEAGDHFGRVDVAINNAVYRFEADFLEQNLEQWNRNLEVNLGGPFNVCQAVIPGMIEGAWGRIVNFSGIAPYLGHGAAKGAAKLGIVGFTRGIASEFAAHSITANCIGPGLIDVDRDPWQHPKPLPQGQPIRRLGQPAEIADLAVFLASEQAGYITGQCYLANGGQHYQ